MTTDRQSPSGPLTSLKVDSVSFALASAVASAAVEVTVAVPLAKVGDVITVSPDASVPSPRVISYARCGTAGSVSLGVGNLATASVAAATVVANLQLQRR